jgi:ParB-like chromosome segregation protein Spo0J
LESIELNAVIVTRNPGDLPYRLSAGLHRLEACKRLGWKEIPATVTTLTGPRAELIEVDENLAQTGLSPSERAIFAWNAVLDIFGNTSSLSAKKEFVRRIADDLDATIQFVNETFAPSRLSLNGASGGVSQANEAGS